MGRTEDGSQPPMQQNSRGLRGTGTNVTRTAPVFTGELARCLWGIGTTLTRTGPIFTGDLVHPSWV